MQTVNRYTRAGKDGKIIQCPECSIATKVYHFAWTALGCPQCKSVIEKNKWLLGSWYLTRLREELDDSNN